MTRVGVEGSEAVVCGAVGIEANVLEGELLATGLGWPLGTSSLAASITAALDAFFLAIAWPDKPSLYEKKGVVVLQSFFLESMWHFRSTGKLSGTENTPTSKIYDPAYVVGLRLSLYNQENAPRVSGVSSLQAVLLTILRHKDIRTPAPRCMNRARPGTFQGTLSGRHIGLSPMQSHGQMQVSRSLNALNASQWIYRLLKVLMGITVVSFLVASMLDIAANGK
jgi:hypothetical protein